MLLALLVGCSDFYAWQEVFEDLTNPLVVQSVYLGAGPWPEDLPAPDAALTGSSARVLLADAASVDALDQAPVTDAEVVLAAGDDAYTLRAEGEGAWVADSTDGLGFTPGDAVVLEIAHDGPHSLALVTPDAPDYAPAATRSAGAPLTIDLQGEAYDNLLVQVIRATDGVTVFDSMPTDISSLYRLTHAPGELVVEVPGDAFAEPGVYVVGVAGLVNAHPDDYEDVNVALSALTAGSMTFASLTVAP